MNQIKNIDDHIMQSPDMDTVERLMVLRRELEAMDARKAFQRDFTQLQSVLPSVQKSGRAAFKTRTGGRMQYSYVKIDDLTNALKPYMSQYGFSFSFRQKEIHDKIAVCCVVMHVEGHRETTEMTSIIDTSGSKNHLQAIASTVSYLKRLTFTSAFGLSVTDQETSAQNPYYPNSAFKRNFSAWQLILKNRRKTPEQLIEFLTAKGIRLSDEQASAIRNCV